MRRCPASGIVATVPQVRSRRGILAVAVAVLITSVLPGPFAAGMSTPRTVGSPRPAVDTRAQPNDANDAVTAAATCGLGWSAADTTYARSALTSVVRSGRHEWAVGMTSTAADEPRYPLATTSQGGAWKRMPITPAAEERALFGIDRSSSGRLWSVGYRLVGSTYRPLLLRWTGGRWSPVALGDTGRQGGALVGVRAWSDWATWAVGYQVDARGQHPLLLRYQSSSWRPVTLPIGKRSTGALLAVDARSASDAWAVGWVATTADPRPWIVHWDGHAWRAVPPARSGTEGVLTSVAMAGPDDVWAVGHRVAGGRYRPFVQHWDGKAWSTVTFPSVGSPIGVLRSVRIGAGGVPVIAGSRWNAASGRWQGLVAWRPAGGWRMRTVPDSVGTSDLRGVAPASDGSALVVGANGSTSLALSACPDASGGSAMTATALSAGPLGTEPATGTASALSATTGDPPSSVAAAGVARGRAPARPAARAARRSDTTSGPRVVARDVTAAAGLARDTSSYGAVPADFDGDGWPDLFIGRHSNPGWLMLDDDGRFRSAPGVTFPDRDRHGCAAADVNDDGRMDLYCAIGASHGAALKANELWIAQPDGTFRDKAIDLLASDPFGRGRLAAFFDLDHDRYPDLFLADRPDRTDGLPSRHRVLADPGGRGFRVRTSAGFDATTGADCIRTGDLDGDGWEDVLLCSRSYRPGGDGLVILRNVRGRLVDVTAASGIQKRHALDAAIADLDGDGRPDIVEVTADQLRVHLRRGSHYVLGYTRTLTNGAAVAVGDADGDGDPDIYVAQGSGSRQRPDQMLLNEGDGRSFRRLALPAIATGRAESVTAIDHDRNGLTDFLVLNGSGSAYAGPIQLIAFYPVP
jgi:FG-GAP-like repeat